MADSKQQDPTQTPPVDSSGSVPQPEFPVSDAHLEVVQRMRAEVKKAVVGQDEVIDQVLIGLLASGHVIIEGLPGLGKTLLARSLAKTFDGQSTRIQFTPDLMPSDITGHTMYDVSTGQFRTRRGPVFTNLLLADEINRAPAKTQAAMLEVMQERQVSLDGKAMPLSPPFMTIATQNPFEHEGTYPLPDAQLDRFLLKIHIDYPALDEELDMVERVTRGHVGDALVTEAVESVADAATVLQLQAVTAGLKVDRRVLDYAVRIARATREWAGVALGAGPRGGLAVVRAARAAALLSGRDFVTPDDIKYVAVPALRHRISLAPELEIEGQTAEMLLADLLSRVDAPRL